MKSAKEILSMVQLYYHRIRTERLSLEALYQDTYGYDLKIDYDLDDRVQCNLDPHYNEGLLIDKILRLDKKLEEAQKRVNHYVGIVDWLENLCIETLNEDELLVIRLSFFGKQPLSCYDIATKLHFSESWVAHKRADAYHKLDNKFLELTINHQLPEEFDDTLC